MSTNSTGVDATVNVTLLDVVSPAVGGFSDSVLGKAKAQHAENASKALVELATSVMLSAQARLATEKQAVIDLEAALVKAKEKYSATSRAVTHADKVNAGLFALAAYLGLKGNIQYWCRSNAVVVPGNDDPVWTVPTPEPAPQQA